MWRRGARDIINKMKTTKDVLRFKYGVSKGRNTYGYRIVSLYVNGQKEYSTNGGGYDMRGSVLGRYLTNKFQDELMQNKDLANTTHIQNEKHEWSAQTKGEGLYGMSLLVPQKLKEHVSLDGACGMNSMIRIAEAIGLKVEYLEDDILLVTNSK